MQGVAPGAARPTDHVPSRAHVPKHELSFRSTLANATAEAAQSRDFGIASSDAPPSLFIELEGAFDANSVADVVSRVVQHPRAHAQKQDSSRDFSARLASSTPKDEPAQVHSKTHSSRETVPQADDSTVEAPPDTAGSDNGETPVYVAPAQQDAAMLLKIPSALTADKTAPVEAMAPETAPPEVAAPEVAAGILVADASKLAAAAAPETAAAISYVAPAQTLSPVRPDVDLPAAGPKELVFQLTLRVPAPKPVTKLPASMATPASQASQDTSVSDAGATLSPRLLADTTPDPAVNTTDWQLARQDEVTDPPQLAATTKFSSDDSEPPTTFREKISGAMATDRAQSEQSQSQADSFARDVASPAMPAQLAGPASAPTFIMAAPVEATSAQASRTNNETAAATARPNAGSTVAQPKTAFPSLQSIGVLVRAADQVIRLQVRQTMGTVRVAVHSDDAALNEQLRNSLPQLVRRLDEQGFQPRVSLAPIGPAAVVLHHDTAHADMHSRDGSYGKDDASRQQQQQQQQRQRQSQRAWQGLASELQED